jgi:MoxR-like ATPase
MDWSAVSLDRANGEGRREENATMPQLMCTRGQHNGRALRLSPNGLVMGRASESDLVLDDLQVSSRHAHVRTEDDEWWVYDLDSSNGTFVNGRSIQAIKLRNGDVIGVGDSLFQFQTGPEERAPAPPPPPRPPPPAEPTLVPPPAPPAERAAAPRPKSEPRDDVERVARMSEKTAAIRGEVGKVIVGQVSVFDQVLMCLLADGHGLLVGLPGMAKTLMVRTIAKVLDLRFKRIQFTPDLMPTDITGTEVLETNRTTGEKEFRFIPGPVFCNILLADEINRTPPKTQAALLEAMQEKRVTAGNVTHELDAPFFVLATQNPIEQEGTYPLPEAQLDRFMFNIWVDYPEEEEEERIVSSTTSGTPPEPQCILRKDEVLLLQDVVRKIPVSRHVVKYAIRLVRASRPVYADSPQVTRTYVSTGAGPRAGQYLILAAKARAVLEGRIHVSCADVREAAVPVLRHRILTNFAADSEGLTSMAIIARLLEQVPEPSEADYTAT